MAIRTASGSRLYIGPTTLIDTTITDANTEEDILAAFEAIPEGNWTLVGEVEDFGEGGDAASDVTFASVGDSRIRHLKGASDAGTRTFVVGDDPLDAGQNAMRAAQKAPFDYNFRIILNNAPTEAYDPGVEYFRGPVQSRRRNIGTNDNVVRRSFTVGNSSGTFERDPVIPTP